MTTLTAPALGLSTQNADWCYSQWQIESAKYSGKAGEDYQGLLPQWQTYEGKCKGSVIYEAELALLYSQLNDHQKARQALAAVDYSKSKYAYMADLVKLINQANERISSNSVDEQFVLGLEDQYLAYTKKYPNIPEGYAQLGTVQVDLKKFSSAASNLERAVESGQQQWLVYRGLAISYAAIGRYSESYAAASSAMTLRGGLTSDPPLMYAIAISNAGLGKFTEARQALLVISTKEPEVKSDPDFIEAVQFVIRKMKEVKSP